LPNHDIPNFTARGHMPRLALLLSNLMWPYDHALDKTITWVDSSQSISP
jgi:hypothetical protein